MFQTVIFHYVWIKGRLHEQKMKEANHAAAAQIFERVNTSLLPLNVLDLHGLHVDEAVNQLSRVLQEKSNGRQKLIILVSWKLFSMVSTKKSLYTTIAESPVVIQQHVKAAAFCVVLFSKFPHGNCFPWQGNDYFCSVVLSVFLSKCFCTCLLASILSSVIFFLLKTWSVEDLIYPLWRF